MIELEINRDDLERMREAVGVTKKLGDKALLRSLRRTQKWLRTRVQREVSKATKMPARAIRARVRLRLPTQGNLEARIWIGLNAMPASRAGKPTGARPGKPTRTGVRAGKYRFPHAFIIKGDRVVQRTSTKRFPVEAVKIPIAEAGFRALEQKAWPDTQRYFLDEFERLMRLELQRARQ